MSSTHKRLKALLAVVIAGVFVFAAAQPVAAATEPDTIAAQVNSDRAAQGLGALARNPALDAVAAAWAAQMGAAGVLSHNPSVVAQVPAGSTLTGENVAYGQPTGTAMETAWLASAPHRANILGDYTDIGVAFVTAGGTTWGVQVFAKY